MENQTLNATVSDSGAPATSVTGASLQTQPTPEPPMRRRRTLFGMSLRTILLVVVGLLVAGGTVFALAVGNTRDSRQNSVLANADSIRIQDVPLNELVNAGNLGLSTSQSLSINGQLRVNNSLVLAPSSLPATGVIGQVLYDKDGNGLAYFDGNKFVAVASSDEVANLQAQLQAQSSALTGLSGQFASTPTIRSDVAGLNDNNIFTGTNTFTSPITANSGISVGGASQLQGSLTVTGDATLSNASIANLTVNGVATFGSVVASSLVLNTPLDVASGGTGVSSLPLNSVLIGQGNGAIGSVSASGADLCLMSTTSGPPAFQPCPGGVGSGVYSLNGLTGSITLANSSNSGSTITIDNASTIARGIASFSATNFTVSSGAVNTVQNISVASTPTFAGLNLSSALAVSSGGTGTNTLTANGVIIGNGSSALTSVAAGSTGLCLMSTAGAPAFQACPTTTIPANVSSLNGLTGALNINNASTSGSTITINDASTSTKGIASFNSTNFTVSGGAVNTVQNISSTSTPTFAGINTGQITAATGLTVSTPLNNNITLATSGTGALYLTGYDCSGSGGGGKLTVNGAGRVICAADGDTDTTGITSLVAGNGISVTNTNEISVRLQSGYGLAFDAASPHGLGLQACAAGQVLKSTGSGWECAADVDTGDGQGVTTIGALDGGVASPTGASIGGGGSTLYLQSASNSFAGLVSTGAQTFAGAKTFGVQTTFSGGLVIASGQNLRLGTTCVAGQVLTTNGSGQVICTTDDTGTDTGVNAVGALDGQTKTASGAVISGNTIYLQTADSTNPGLVSTGSQTFAGAKTFSNQAIFSAGLNVGAGQAIGSAGSLTVSAATNTNLSLSTSGTGSLYFLGYNCSAFGGGGKLTVNGTGQVLCAADGDTDTTGITSIVAGAGISVTNTNEVSVQLRAGYGLAFDAVNPHGVGLTSCATNEILKSNGSGWDCASDQDTGDGQGITTIGALDGGIANANGASIGGGGSTLYLQSASALNGGLVNTSAQTFAGAKTFAAQASFSSGLSVASGQAVTIGTACATGQVLTTNASRQLICVTDDTGTGDGEGITTVGTIDSQTKSANGAVISGNTIYLQNADATNVGLVSSAAQTFGGLKTFAGGVTISNGQNLTLGTTCTSGQVLSTNGSGQVICTTDAVGTGDGEGITTVGGIDTQTKSSNGAVIVGNTIYLQTADATSIGLVSTGAQSFAGAKTFADTATFNAGASITGNLGITGTINSATISGGSLTGGAFSGGTVSGGTLTATTVNGLTVNSGAITAPVALTVSVANDQNLTLGTSGTGALYLSGYDCSASGGGGKLTVDGSGRVICAADGDTDTTGITSIVAGAGISVTNSNEVSVQLRAGYGLAFDAVSPYGVGLTSCAVNEILKSNGSGWDCASDVDTGDGQGITTIGTLDGGVANANGASIGGGGSTLYLQSASGVRNGIVTTNAQTFAGAKTFSGSLIANAGITIASGQNLTLGTVCTTGQVLTTNGSGVVQCVADQEGTDTGVTTVGGIDTQTKSSNGAVIVGNTIYLQTADATSVGMVSTGAQSFAGAKTFNAAATFGSGASVTGNLGVSGTINSATISGGSLTGGTFSGGTVSGGSLTATTVNGLTVTSGAITAPVALTVGVANNQNLTLGTSGTGGLYLSGYDCSASGGGGKLTVDSSGRVLCAADVDTDTTGITSIVAGAGISVSNTNEVSVQLRAGYGLAFDAVNPYGVGLTSCATNEILKSNGSGWDCASDVDTGDGQGITAIGALDGGIASADGASIGGGGSTLYLQSASGVRNGIVTTNAQTFAGAKTFSGSVTASAGITIASGQSLTLGTICSANQVLTTNGSGVVQCVADQEGTDTGVTTVGGIDTQTKSSNGAVIVGSTIYLQTADATSVGMVSTGAQSFAGAKTFNAAATFGAGATVTGNLGVSGTINSATISGGSLTGGTFSGGTVSGGSLTATTVNGLTVNSGEITAPVALTVGVANNQNLTLATSGSGALYLSGYDCSASGGGGKLTVDGSGRVICADDGDTDTTGITSIVAGAGISVTNTNEVSVQLRAGYGLAFDAVSPYGVGLTSCAVNEILKSNGSGWDCASDVDTGDGQGITTIGTLDGGVANANGASIGGGGSTLYLQSASGVRNGIVTTNAQTFAGAKTFSGALTASAGITIASGQNLTLGTVCTTGQVLTTNGSGVVQCVADQEGTDTGVTAVGALDSQAKSANGAVVSGNSIYLQTADATNPGLVSAGTQTFGGNKTFANNLQTNGNFTQSGTGTFSTGTGAVNLNGTTVVAADFTVQNAGSNSLLNVSTSSSKVTIGQGRTGNSFTKVADPDIMPLNLVGGVAFSDNNQYLAVGFSSTSPRLHIYKRSGDTFTKLANPATVLPSNGNAAAWSPDTSYLAFAHNNSPYVTIYKRSGDTFTKLADPSSLPAGTGNGVAFSPDGQYLTVTHSTAPYVTIYKRSGDTFTKLADPSSLPAGIGYSVTWSPNGLYMVVGHSTSPTVTIYKRTGDTFTKLANPAALPSGNGFGVSFSPDSTYLSIAQSTSPYITTYKRSGDTFTKLADPDIAPTGVGRSISWAPDGEYLTIGHDSSPYITTYQRTGDAFTKTTNPVSLPASDGDAVDWSSDGQYLVVGGSTVPRLAIYKVGDGQMTDLVVNGTLTASSASLTGLSVAGTSMLQGSLSVSGVASFADGVYLSGTATLDGAGIGLAVTNNATIGGTLTVTNTIIGASTVQGSRLISTISTGTAPLTVASTTKVDNLNSDLLDGLDSTAFAVSSGSANYIQNQNVSDQVANFRLSGSGQATTLNATSGFQINGTAGSSTTCTGGNVLGNITIAGGIITGGTCATNGGGVSPTLQNVYDNSGTANPQIQLGSTNGGLKIRDASTTVGNIFQIMNNGGTTSYLNVTSSGTSVAGTFTASSTIQGTTLNATTGYQINGVNGANTTCSGGQFLQNQVVAGGLVTGGTCATITGDGQGITAVGALDGGTANATGATISGNTIYLQSASTSFAGLVNTGTQSFAGVKTFTNNVNLSAGAVIAANQSLTVTGGTTANRPSSPTEGMIFFDTTTKQLLTYANGKWKADGKDAVFVAASNSSQADKDAADYVADGNTAAANDGDQVQINQALTAAAGKKVVLLAGTYVADATILVPNNTTLSGVGQGTEIQFAALSVNDSMIVNTDTTTGTGIVLKNLVLNGRADLNGSRLTTGVDFTGMGAEIGRRGASVTDIEVKSFTYTGIYVQGFDNHLSQLNIQDGTNALHVAGNGNMVTDSYFTNSEIITNGANVISSNQFNSASIFVTGTNAVVSNNGMLYAPQAAIKLEEASYVTVANNNIYNAGGSSDNNAIVSNGYGYFTITGNTIFDDSATVTNYAINLGTGGPNDVSGNSVGTGMVVGNIRGGQINELGNYVIQSGGTIELLNNTNISSDLAVTGAISGASLSVTGAVAAASANITGNLQAATVNATTGYQINGVAGATTTCSGGQFLQNQVVTGGITTGGTCASVTSGATTVGALDGGTANATGATISGSTIYLQSASATYAGLVNTGTQTFAGNKTFTGSLNVQSVTIAANQSLTVTGGTTANRPSSPTEGMIFFDTDTKQLLTYANGKWKADGKDAVFVAASNSSQADKDAADYVADGNTGAANDGDQVQINQALTAAAGKKVVLLAGTYVADATILVPNNTTLAGVGTGTVIELADLDATDNLIENSDTSTGTGVVLNSLRLDGRKDLNTSGTQNGVYLSGMGSGTGASARQGAKVDQLWISNFRNDGIRLDSSGNSAITGVNSQANDFGINFVGTSQYNVLDDNTFQGNMVGVGLTGASHNSFTANIVEGSSSYGISISSSAYNNLNNNVIRGNGGGGIFLNSSSHMTINANSVMNNSSFGVSLTNGSNNNNITSNKMIDNGGSSNNNGVILAASDSNNISTNSITDGTATTNYAINISNSTSDGNYLSSNTLGGGAINDLGTGTIYGGQVNSSGNYVIQPAGTVELMKNTNVTGTLAVTGAISGASVSVTGAVAAASANITGAVQAATFQASTQATVTSTNSAALLVQNASSVALLTANTSNMTVTIGNSGNTITLSTAGLELAGNARHTKKIRLSAEYGGAVLDAGTMSNNTGSMTSGLDLTNRMNFYKWTTTQGTNQSYDIVVQVPIPSDFSAWASSTPISITTRTSDTTNGTITLEARDTGGSVETNCNFVSATPGSTGTWATNSSACTIAGTYTAGEYMTLRIRLQSPNAGDVRVGTIVLTYRAKF